MADNVRPPVAVRIVRPYDTEEAFLESELETVGKTSVILIGAHPRPAGVILRFEVTLASGKAVLRGEGRVLGHKESAFRGQPGLALRFTRLDPKSKALVDRAAAMRDARLSGENPAARPAVPSPPPSSDPVVAPSSPPSGRTPFRTSAPPPGSSSNSVPAPDPVLTQMLTSPTPPPPAISPPRPSERAGKRRSVQPGRPSTRPVSAPPAAEAAPAREAAALPEEALAPAETAEPTPSAEAPPAAEAVEAAEAAEAAPPPPAEAAEPSRPDVSALVDDAERHSIEPSVQPPPSAGAALEAAAPALSEASPVSVPPSSLAGDSLTDATRGLTPTDRESLLSRLRQRARGLSDEQVAALLRQR